MFLYLSESKFWRAKRVMVLMLIVLIGLGTGGFFVYKNISHPEIKKKEIVEEEIFGEITSFEECVEAGHSILESYPRQCKMFDGKTFVEDIGNELEKQDLIRVSRPRPNELIKSLLEIKGEARGYWFFEADFPVRLLDANDKELGTGIAKTSLEWMTKDFVPFEATLEFQIPTTRKGMLVLKKDNPSGLPGNADELRIPVRF